jgi:hypothetical protein
MTAKAVTRDVISPKFGQYQPKFDAHILLPKRPHFGHHAELSNKQQKTDSASRWMSFLCHTERAIKAMKAKKKK